MGKVTLYEGVIAKIAEDKAAAGLRGALSKAESILKEDILRRPGTGKKYGDHQASAPGEPPALDSGNLRLNTNADTILGQDGGDLVGSVIANTEYAEALEKGSKHTAKSRTADGLFGMRGKYGPARMTALESEVGTERTAPRPFLSLLATDHAEALRRAFIAGAKE